MSLLFQVNNFLKSTQWKEHEEERTHTTYIRENCAYHPIVGAEGECFIKQQFKAYIRVLAQVHVLQGTTSCAAGMVTTVGIIMQCA